MISCGLCPGEALGVFAVTSLAQTDVGEDAWKRGLAPLCARCHKALQVAGSEGRRLKATEEQWWLGHVVGMFSADGERQPDDQ